MEDYEENIDQYVRDEKKIVTFSWLSVELNIPVHTAKQLLWAYLQKHPQLKASYLVSGETANERIFRVVPASQLEDAKKSFRRVVGVHVFSIQETTPTDSALLVSEDLSLRRSMIDNGDALTHPLLDGRYNAVSYAAGRELRRAGSGVRPEAAKSKSLPPSDFRSKQKEEKVDVAPPMAKAKSAVSAELTVKEGVKSVSKPKGMMQFFGKGSKAGKADDEGDNPSQASPAPHAAVSVKAEEKEPAAAEVKKEAPKRAASAKDFFAPRAKSDAAAAAAPAAAKVKEEKKASSDEDEAMADAAPAKAAVAEAKAASRNIVASDEEEGAPLNASQGRKKRVIQDSDEEDADFAAAPAKRASPDAKSKEEPKPAKKAEKKAADAKSKKQAEAASDGESPKKKKAKSKTGGDEAAAAEGDVQKEKKRKTKEDKGEAKVKKTKSEVKAEKAEGGKEPKKAKKRKGSDLEESDNEASGQPAPPTKSIPTMFQPPASSQPSSALSVGSGSGPTPKRKVKQTRRYKNEKGYLVSETIEVEVDDEPAPPAAPAPQPAKKAEEPKAAAKSAAPAAAAGVKKEKEEETAAAAAEPAKKVAQSNITSFFRKK